MPPPRALSILSISKNLLERAESPFEYVLTYRFSQDTLEMYFSKIRSRFGWNNNPTALQFKYALRSLLLKNKIEAPKTANCVQLTEEETEVGPGKVDSSVSNLLLSSNVWRSDVLHYIAGYIVRKVQFSSVQFIHFKIHLIHHYSSTYPPILLTMIN